MTAPVGLVIAGVDFSEGDAAARWGAAAAARHGCRLLLLHARPEHESYQDHGDWATPGSGPGGVDNFPLHALSALGSRLRAVYPGLDVATWLTHQSPGLALLTEARDGTLLVVGAVPSAHRDDASGPLALQILQHADTAVAMAKATRTPEGPVAVAVDPQHPSVEAVSFAMREAALRDVDLRVVHLKASYSNHFGEWASVGPAPPGPASCAVDAVTTAVAQYPTVHVEVCSRTGDASEILRRESASAQLLVLAAHGPPGTPRPMLGSAVYDAALHADCTVVVVPTHARRGTAGTSEPPPATEKVSFA